jgi:hypothetical protein
MLISLYPIPLVHIWKQTKYESLVRMAGYFGYSQNDIRLKMVFGNNDKIYNYIPSLYD